MVFGNLGNTCYFPAEQPDLPDYSNIDRIRVLRTAGTQVTGEMLGSGFLRKNVCKDLINWRYPNFVLVIILIFGTRDIFRDSPFCNPYLINDY